MSEDLLEGTNVRFGRKTLVVPPLTFSLLKKLAPKLQLMKSIDRKAIDITDEEFDAMVEIVHVALMRNYPNTPRSEVEEFLDIANLPKIVRAIMNQSGLNNVGEATPGR